SITWKTQPVIDGPLLGQAGAAVRQGQVVDFDVTSAIGGDGVYCFALDTASKNNLEYNSKEAATGKPQALLTVLPPVVPFCGDGRVDCTGEQCDGTADSACPGRCRVDCTCASPPVCGDNLVNQVSEQCDGTVDNACPGRCRAGGARLRGQVAGEWYVRAGAGVRRQPGEPGERAVRRDGGQRLPGPVPVELYVRAGARLRRQPGEPGERGVRRDRGQRVSGA